uniref:Uncharacterized protein n=1 Tax=Meloidogyne enterolobii TaxID=390850 RepID=A0A6V7WM60_MELEN|nr:unnamed protein product [Meloidogyne enterolobii]
MLSHNSKVHMKIIPNEGPKDFNISKAYRYNWFEKLENGLNNYHLAEVMKDKKIYVGCNRCKKYFWFEQKDNFNGHNNTHNKLDKRMAEISKDVKSKQLLIL